MSWLTPGGSGEHGHNHDCRGSGFLPGVLLDPNIRSSSQPIVDSAYFVPFIDGCHGTWAQFVNRTSANPSCLFWCEGASHHTQLLFLLKSGLDRSSEILRRAAIRSTHAGCKILHGVWFALGLFFRWPYARGLQCGRRDVQGTPCRIKMGYSQSGSLASKARALIEKWSSLLTMILAVSHQMVFLHRPAMVWCGNPQTILGPEAWAGGLSSFLRRWRRLLQGPLELGSVLRIGGEGIVHRPLGDSISEGDSLALGENLAEALATGTSD